ncbi:MAG: hypothetical protein KGI08_10435 [Thaumarchaeota archaeon]|nr:hypothetical protein [Nitrososphaerota archaeon]
MTKHIHIHVGSGKTKDADPISSKNKSDEEVKKEKRDDKRILSAISQQLKQLSYFGRQNGAADIERAIDKLFDKIDDR